MQGEIRGCQIYDDINESEITGGEEGRVGMRPRTSLWYIKINELNMLSWGVQLLLFDSNMVLFKIKTTRGWFFRFARDWSLTSRAKDGMEGNGICRTRDNLQYRCDRCAEDKQRLSTVVHNNITRKWHCDCCRLRWAMIRRVEITAESSGGHINWWVSRAKRNNETKRRRYSSFERAGDWRYWEAADTNWECSPTEVGYREGSFYANKLYEMFTPIRIIRCSPGGIFEAKDGSHMLLFRFSSSKRASVVAAGVLIVRNIWW